MSEATFTIVYDGPALRDHSMDVRDLAPAMLGLGELFDAANSALNGDNARIKVQVKATEPGCFQITFEVIQTIGAQLVSLLSGPSVRIPMHSAHPYRFQTAHRSNLKLPTVPISNRPPF